MKNCGLIRFPLPATVRSRRPRKRLQRRQETADPNFGVEDKSKRGTLTTKDQFEPSIQTFDEESKTWTGKVPTITERWVDYYEDVVAAIRGEKEVKVKLEESGDVIRLIELVRGVA